MKKTYFLVITYIGLLLAALLATFILGKDFFLIITTTDKYNGTIPVLAGAVTCILAARYFDKMVKISKSFIITVIPVLIFLLGVIAGSAVIKQKVV